MMGADSIRARIEHEAAELRARHPRLTSCDSALVQWSEDGEARYSLKLDIRWPSHQTLVSGAAHDSAEAAVNAAFRQAEEKLR